MTVAELIARLLVMPQDAQVHCDMDDYPYVTEVRRGVDYEGPVEYTPPENCVLLIVDFPK